MKRWIFSFFLTLSTTATFSCTEHMIEQQGSDFTAQSFQKGDAEYLAPYFVQSEYLAVKAMQITKFDTTQKKKMMSALELLEKVVNSETFKDRILNFKNTKGERAFASNKGLSNEEIYAEFMEGREMLQQDTPGEMNFYLKLYNKRFSNTIGWTNPDINLININNKYFKDFDFNEVAGNLAHEWTHKIGFGHASAKEHDSAPYAIGYIVRELGKEYIKTGILE